MPFKKSAKKSSPVPPTELSKKPADATVASTLAAATKPATVVTASVAKSSVSAAPIATMSAPVVVAGPSAAAVALIQALRDPSADTASEAATSLGKLGEAAAVAPLIEVIANVDDYFHSVVRAAACHSLGQLRDRSAVPALLAAIRDPMAEASAEAVRALATIGDDRAIAPLIDVVRNEHGFFLPVVRLAAVTALKQFKTAESAAALKAIAADASEDAVLRAAAV